MTRPAGPLHAVNVDGFPLVAPGPAASSPPVTDDEPSFAVLIAAYNAESTIVETLESALGQTLAPSQVIVCDDGSTDRTAELVSGFAPQVELVSQPNSGDAAARNAALARATTTHVVVLDSDDMLEPRCLEAYRAALRARPDLDLVTCDAYLEADGVLLGRYYGQVAYFVVDDQRLGALHQHFVFGFPAIRRAALLAVGGWSTEAHPIADTDLFLRLALAGSAAGLVYEPLARYRLRADSLSDDRARGLRAMVQVVERALEHPSLTPEERVAVEADLRVKERLTRVAELEDALRRRSRDTRAYALRIAQAGELGYPLRVRARSLAAAVAPALAATAVRARDARRGVTPLRTRTRNLGQRDGSH